MITHKKHIVTALVIGAVLVSGCMNSDKGDAGKGPSSAFPLEPPIINGDESKDQTLRIMARYEEPTDLVEYFELQFPGVQVEWEYIKEDMDNQIKKALVSDRAPDLIIADLNWLSEASRYDMFRDLSGPEYDPSWKEWFPGLDRSRFTSPTSGATIGIPKDMPATLTFYRADLFEKYGFPSEPEELGIWLENPENLIKLAVELKKYNHHIFQWEDELIDVPSDYGYGILDEELESVRNETLYADLIQVSREIKKQNLPAYMSIWDERGQAGLRNDDLVMFFMGEWGYEVLKHWVPDTSLWKTTRLPLNMYGIHGGYFHAIPKFAVNHHLSWEYIKFVMYWEQNYRKGMTMARWYDRLPPHYPTALDTKGKAIWRKAVIDLLESSKTPEEIASDASRKVVEELAEEIKLLRDAASILSR